MGIWDVVGLIVAIIIILFLLFIGESLIYNKIEEIRMREFAKKFSDSITFQLQKSLKEEEEEEDKEDE